MKTKDAINQINRILILQPILDKIASGKFFRQVFCWFYRGLAVLVILGVLWASWMLWSNLPSRSGVAPFIGGLLFEVFLVVIGFVTFNILWIRAENILKLPMAKDYSVTPIMVISIKMAGEVFASFSALFGLAFGLVSWIAGPQMMRAIPLSLPLPGMSGAATGALPMISGIVFGFIILATSYFMAETCGALVDIARNTKKTK